MRVLLNLKKIQTYDVIILSARGEKRLILKVLSVIHCCEVIFSNFIDEIVSLKDFLNFPKIFLSMTS